MDPLPRSSVINQIPMPPVKPPRDPKRDEDLVKMLLTCDGAGKAAKKEALAELLARAIVLGNSEFGRILLQNYGR